MRKISGRLAFFFILITITRVALFVTLGLRIGWLGYAFAIGLAAGVYVTAYFIRFPSTKWPAGIGLLMFGIGDLFFNEMELIRSLSSTQFVTADANFLGIGSDYLRYAMQVSALIFGAFPTFAAAILGWLQSGAERIASLKTRAWLGNFGLAIAARLEKWMPESEDTQVLLPASGQRLLGNSGNGNIGIVKARWDDLSMSAKSEIAGKTEAQIVAAYGGSPRRARMWKQWVKSGKI